MNILMLCTVFNKTNCFARSSLKFFILSSTSKIFGYNYSADVVFESLIYDLYYFLETDSSFSEFSEFIYLFSLLGSEFSDISISYRNAFEGFYLFMFKNTVDVSDYLNTQSLLICKYYGLMLDRLIHVALFIEFMDDFDNLFMSNLVFFLLSPFSNM